MNMNEYFFQQYFEQHVLNNETRVRLRALEQLGVGDYEAQLQRLATHAADLTVALKQRVAGGGQCTVEWLAQQAGAGPPGPRIIWYAQQALSDAKVARKLTSCLRVWDLGEVRGLYRGVLRLHLAGRPLLLAGQLDSAFLGAPPAAVLDHL